MTKAREVDFTLHGTETRDGAGVRLTRIFAHAEAERMDPFLLLDFFGSDNPDDYMAGFPMHPHRGIETITYMLHGEVAHEDSLGNAGVIGPGDVQWMTAGSGIIHQEMPRESENGVMRGFQLWANLPSTQKMTHPKYRDVTQHDIPIVEAEGVVAKIVAGVYRGVEGPVRDVVIDPEYLDIEMRPGARLSHEISQGHTVFAYVFRGQVAFGEANQLTVEEGTLVVFQDGESVEAHSDGGGRLLLISGRPLREPIAWYGPIVMNTPDELDLAFKEFRAGTFIKHS
jgi:redox-sensitive bicupin YhaK (pirin superfamily)